ncbi:hypothetical protein OROMI_013531 [Orobanche minor]
MENILSRLPVKSLLLFKSVCKHWNATISDDPQFAATHLRRSKNSSSSCLVYGDGKTELVDFKDAEIRRFSSVDFPVLGSSSMHILCYCDGLYVLAYEYWLRREIVLCVEMVHIMWIPTSPLILTSLWRWNATFNVAGLLEGLGSPPFLTDESLCSILQTNTAIVRLGEENKQLNPL